MCYSYSYKCNIPVCGKLNSLKNVHNCTGPSDNDMTFYGMSFSVCTTYYIIIIRDIILSRGNFHTDNVKFNVKFF